MVITEFIKIQVNIVFLIHLRKIELERYPPKLKSKRLSFDRLIIIIGYIMFTNNPTRNSESHN